MSNVIGNLRVVLGLDSAAFQRGMQEATSSLRDIGRDMQRVGRSLSIRLTAPIAGFGGLVAKTAGDFEAAMNQVAAVSGATGDQLEALTKQAKELGATTQFTASQAAEAMGFLAMAGYETEQILGAMPDTLKLASSAQLDMASAADIVTNILSGYNKEVGDLANVTDVLVNAFTNANTDLVQLGEAMKYAGPVANAAGVEFEEAAAALGMMGGAGIQASMAGTSLRGAISRSLSPTKKMAGIMEEAGLSFTDAGGRLLPLADIIEQLEPHADNAGMMMELFGQRAGPAMAALVSQGSDELRGFTEELRNSAGTADRVSAVQMQGFNGAIRELSAAFEALKLAIADAGLLAVLSDLVRGLSRLISRMSQANPEMLKWATIIAAVAAALGPVLIGLGALLAGVGPLIAGIAGIGAAIKVMSAALFANPIGLALTAIATAAYLIWDNWETVGPWLKDLFRSLGDVFEGAANVIVGLITGDLTLAVEGLKQAWEGLDTFFRTLLGGVVEAFESAWAKIEPIIEWLTKAEGLLDRINQGYNRVSGAGRGGPISSGPYTGGATGPIMPGTDMVMGLEDGTESIRNQGRTDAQAYGDGFREGMGIQSPSRVMMEIGEYLSQGLAIGIGNGQGTVSAESDRVGQSFADSITPYFDGVIRGTQSVKEAFASMLQDMASRLFSSGLSGVLGAMFPGGGIRIPGFAAGVSHFRGGMAEIHERGGELAIMPSGSTVIPHDLSKRMVDGQGGGLTNINVNVTGANGDQHVISLVQQGVSMGLRQYDRALPDRIGQINSKPRWR